MRQHNQHARRMDTQTAFNIVLSLVAFLGGWVLNSLRDSLKTLQLTDNELATKVQRIEVLVAGSYVKREDIDKLTAALFAKLDKIEAKLDLKADK
jgi:hypothetical protein